MIHVTNSVEIDAPAGTVWRIVGEGFADVSLWASTVPASGPHDRRSAGLEHAPVAGRTCETTFKGIPHVEETITAYDDERRTLTFRATGLPPMIASAYSTWRIEPLGARRARVSLDGKIALKGLAKVMTPLMSLNFKRQLDVTLDDLKQYAETGKPSARKVRRLVKAAA